MTRDEILALLTGRELDALVAQQILGWTDICCPEPEHGPASHDGISGVAPDPLGGNCWGRRWLPHYATDIAAAWELVEKFSDYAFHLYGDCGTYTAWFGEAAAEAPTAAHAICLAALIKTLDLE